MQLSWCSTHISLEGCACTLRQCLHYVSIHNSDAMQVDSNGNADSTAGPPKVSEAEVKEAWLASCRTIYEVQPHPATCCPPVLLASSAAFICLNTGGFMACMQLLCERMEKACMRKASALRQRLCAA